MATKASAKIGQRLLSARSNRGLTMAELGNKAEVSASTVNHIEKGRQIPNADTVESLAGALGIDPCWLAYGTGTQPEWVKSRTDTEKGE